MIQNYRRPRLEIAQLLQTLPNRSADRFVPLIMGQQFVLSRYGKETVQGTTFNAAGLDLNYTVHDGSSFKAITDEVVDPASVKVFGERLEAVLGTFAAAATGADENNSKISLYSAASPSVLKIEGGNFVGGVTTDTLKGRSVALGDLIYVDDGNNIFKRKIPASYGQNEGEDDGLVGASDYNPTAQAASTATDTPAAGYTMTTDASGFDALAEGPTVDGKYGDEFTLTVVTGGAPGVATVNVTTKSGLLVSAAPVVTADSAGDFLIAGDDSLAGISITIAGADLVPGQVFKTKVYGAYTPLVTSGVDLNALVSGTFTGVKDTTYIIRVQEGVAGGAGSEFDGAVVQITDSEATEAIQEVTVTTGTPFNLGSNGLQFEFNNATALDQVGLKAGDIYFVHAVASKASTTEFDKILLDGPAVDTGLTNSTTQGLDVEMRLPFTGEIASDAVAGGMAWTAETSVVDIEPALSLKLDARDSGSEWVPFKNGIGYLYPSFRAAVAVGSSENVGTLYSPDDIATMIGANDMDNPLGYGVGRAFEGAFNGVTGKSVKFFRVGADTAAAYTTALSKLINMDNFYAIAPMSDREDVHQAVEAHVEAASTPERMNFRRAYVGVDSPGEWAVLQNESAQISAIDGLFVHVQFTGDVDLTTLKLSAGDKLELASTGNTYEIDSVISETELLLVTGPFSAVSPAVPMNIIKADTAANTAEYLNQRASALNSRRVGQVWSDKATRLINGAVVVVPSMYLAAEIAGLRCAMPVHQGLTNSEISGATSAPNMYLKFDESALNDIAANGTFIVTQDIEGNSLFIRHQLTTNVSEGSLYYEDSVGSNVDEISFAIKDIFGNFIGKRNLTPGSLSEVRKKIQGILDDRLSTELGSILGPQLINWDTLRVEASSVVSDSATARATLTVPLPFNNLRVELAVQQAVNLVA